MIYHIAESTSSNDEARDSRYDHGDIVRVERQTAGRGQRGHSWSDGGGLDLAFSLVLMPESLRASEQFDISRVAALALADTFAEFGIGVRIKWTNDIYVADRKITGILIENELSGSFVSRMVVGIGINVNRREFPPSLPNPTSMVLEAGREFDCDEVLARFSVKVLRLYDTLAAGGREGIRRRYDSMLYRLGEMREYYRADGSALRAAIAGTEPSGRLILMSESGEKSAFAFGEVEFSRKNAGL